MGDRAADARLACLTTWERNFLVFYRRGGLATVRTQLDIQTQAEADQVLAVIQEKLDGPSNNGREAAPESPVAQPDTEAPEPDPEPAPDAQSVDQGGDDSRELDDFGQGPPGPQHVGAYLWEPRHPVQCGRRGECDKRFWQTHPRERYCPDCRPAPRRPAAKAVAKPEPEDALMRRMGEHLDHLSREVSAMRDEMIARADDLDSLRELIRDASAVRAGALLSIAYRLDALDQVVGAPDFDAMDITLGQVAAALAAIGRGELPVDLPAALGLEP